MKGLLLSLLVFVFYVASSVILSHFLKPKRYSKLFLPLLVVALALFLFAYYLTSSNLGFLPLKWQASHPLFDVALGMIILLLNVHSYVDWFFGFNGGFSTSLLMILLKKNQGATTEELISHYRQPTGSKIYGWRLPRLQETGYLKIDQISHSCRLTKKGLLIALAARRIKKILNLGLGG